MHETGARGSDCQKELTTIRVRPQWSNTVWEVEYNLEWTSDRKTWFSTRVRNWFDIVHTAWKLYRNLNNFDKVMGPADKHFLIANESENPRWLARVTLGESELSLNQRNQTTTNDKTQRLKRHIPSWRKDVIMRHLIEEFWDALYIKLGFSIQCRCFSYLNSFLDKCRTLRCRCILWRINQLLCNKMELFKIIANVIYIYFSKRRDLDLAAEL